MLGKVYLFLIQAEQSMKKGRIGGFEQSRKAVVVVLVSDSTP